MWISLLVSVPADCVDSQEPTVTVRNSAEAASSVEGSVCNYPSMPSGTRRPP